VIVHLTPEQAEAVATAAEQAIEKGYVNVGEVRAGVAALRKALEENT
jgi:hypothetical protein